MGAERIGAEGTKPPLEPLWANASDEIVRLASATTAIATRERWRVIWRLITKNGWTAISTLGNNQAEYEFLATVLRLFLISVGIVNCQKS